MAEYRCLVGYDPPRTPKGCSCPCHTDLPEMTRCCLHAPIFGRVIVEEDRVLDQRVIEANMRRFLARLGECKEVSDAKD